MKKSVKRLAALLCLCCLISFCLAGCSGSQREGVSSAAANGESTSSKAEEITDSRNDENVIIDEKTAQELAYSALCETDFSDFGIEAEVEDFELASCELNDGSSRREQFGYTTRVWTVTYCNTNTLCDSIYFDISEEGGALLHSGYQGD